jgi:hypothetical protein
MGDHGVKAMSGHLLQTAMLLDTLMKKFYGPAPPVPYNNLACRGPQIIAGKRLAATLRSVPPCGTHQLALPHVAQRARGVADANVRSLAFVPMRRETHGVPLEPAMTAEKRVDVTPLLRVRGSQSERLGLDAAGFPQGQNAVPALVANGRFDLFVVIAAIGQYQDLTPIIGAKRVLQGQRAQIGHHALLCALRDKTRRLAIPLAIEGKRPQWNQYVTQEPDAIGPLMTDDRALAVMERCGVFRVQTSPVWQRTVDDDHTLPGQPVASGERLGKLPGLGFGEPLQRGAGHPRMRLQQFRKERLMSSRKPGRLFEGMLRGDDHQKEQRVGANPLKPLTDGNPTFDPSLYGASEPRASPRCEHSAMGGGDDSLGKGARCPSTCGKEVICGIPGTASL